LEAREVLDALPDPVILVDELVIEQVNTAARDMIGLGKDLVGKRLASILPENALDRFRLLDFQRAQGWPLPSTCLLRFIRTDGSSVTADVRWVRLAGSRWLLTARDVSDASRAETLMGRLAHLPSTLDGADALFDASEAVFRALGWTVAFAEIIPDASIVRRVIARFGDPVGDYGRSLLDKVLTRSETPVLAEVMRTGQAIFMDNLPQVQPGQVARAVALGENMAKSRVVRSAWVPIRATTDITHVLAVTGHDLTEHDFVAVQLFAAQVGAALRIRGLRMEMVRRERLAAVGEMAAVLAHEVRNPLAVMFNALSSLERGNAEPVNREAGPGTQMFGDLLAILREEGDRLQRLVTDLLVFASTREPNLVPTPLLPLCADVIYAAKHDESYERMSPKVVVDVPESIWVRTDEALLRRALLNVVANAFQHVTSGGTVSVVATVTGSTVRLLVTNDGERIPEDVRKHLFDPFFTKKATGTGLGLAIVRRIATDLGASVTLLPPAPTSITAAAPLASATASTEQAVFEIVLPRAEAATSAKEVIH
jgi:signal transduction histidine kinase